MKVIVKARHMDLTDAMRVHAEEKLGQALMRIFDRPAAKIEIELSDLGHVRAGSKECRVVVHMPGGKSITISELDDDLYSAINLAHDRLLEQVKRAQGKRRHNHRNRLSHQEERRRTARNSMTSNHELWEMELQEFEHSQRNS